MAMVTLNIPNVKRKTETRPTMCPYCQAETLQRWGKVPKTVRDNCCRTLQVYHYRCSLCRRTIHHYHAGVDQAAQTLRLHNKDLLTDLPLQGNCHLFDLWKQTHEPKSGRNDSPLSSFDQLRYPLLRLNKHWDTYRLLIGRKTFD